MLSGMLFMGATEEQLNYLNASGIDISSYSNVLLSFGFAVFLFSFALIYLWEKLTNYQPSVAARMPPSGEYSELPLTGDRSDIVHDAGSDFLDDDEDDAMELKNRVHGNSNHL